MSTPQLLLLVVVIFAVSFYVGTAMAQGELRPWRWQLHRPAPKRRGPRR